MARGILDRPSFRDRLAREAKSIKEQAERLKPGQAQENLLRKARQLETASHINEWLSSPGLQSPK
jgi:hypothetical protein